MLKPGGFYIPNYNKKNNNGIEVPPIKKGQHPPSPFALREGSKL